VPFYLLDTNICIYLLKGQHGIDQRIADVGESNCFISEITIAELKFGAENSERKEENRQVVERFVNRLQIMPIFSALDVYAQEKARLRQNGISVDDFDLLIGATAVANDFIMVTNNVKHLAHLHNIRIENWVK
jgi:tRNA(fMet)-specific endonuclease VapC